MKSSTITREQLAGMFDHTNLKAFATEKDFKKLCEEAVSMGCAMVAINPYPVRMCRKFLKGTGVHVGAAISFPLGQTTIEEKADETLRAIEDGADEIDYVLNVGKLKEGDLAYIRKEMETIVSICREKGVLSKVIFRNICGIDYRFCRKQEPTVHNLLFIVRAFQRPGRFSAFQMGIQTFGEAGFICSLFVSAAKTLFGFFPAFLDRFHVCKDQFKVDRLNVAHRID